MSNEKKGISAIFTSLLIWGFLPIYWKQIVNVTPVQILANRIIWSFVFVFVIILLQRRWQEFFSLKRDKNVLYLIISGFVISLNWGTFIYAVNTGHIVDASLGYYINPLLTILLGAIVLKEKLTGLQIMAVALAAGGVAVITLSYGSVPYIAIILAVSFSTYSLLKRMVKTEVVMGLAAETFAVLPLAAGFLIYLHLNGQPVYGHLGLAELLFLLGSGIATAVPLLLFSYGTKIISLTTVGFLQYLSPTISLFLGIFLYHEPFTFIEGITFLLIWAALIIYSISQVKEYSKHKKIEEGGTVG
ncbi:MAG: EamA family transporter RarD [Peptococcaceae bacterium]|jgi:chloramphenicol-sensitive protein RarD|nr:EamA family transporter RarD [Peptococcaceae bacterium]